VSFPIQSGHPCIGCSESNFWDNGPFYQRLPNFPGFGIEATADTLGVAALGAATAGIAGHALMTNFRKRQEIGEQPGENAEKAEKAEKTEQADGGDSSNPKS
jgi:hydrogenase small subunit